MKKYQIPANQPSKAQILGLKDQTYHTAQMNPQTEKVINEAKRRDRPIIKLEDWDKNHFYKKDIAKGLFDCPDNVDRKEMEDFSVEQFRDQYHKMKKSVIIKGCTKNWKSIQFWSHSNLAEQFANYLFKVGQDDDGQKIRIKMSSFIDYLVHNTDDSPLYLFENLNIVSEELQPILDGYQIPHYFAEDIFKLLEDEDRPLFRWFLMGPERSGSTVHIDPLMTSAWNTSLVGHKRWVLFRPDTPKYIVKGKQFRSKQYVDEAINYFVQILPQIKKKYSQQTLGMVEFIQYPGQTVFVPSGVWHAVLNLDDTIAVTQNFMNEVDFQAGWEAIIEEKKSFAPLLLQNIKKTKPKLYQKTQIIRQHQREDLSQSEEKFIVKSNSKKPINSRQGTEKDFITEKEQLVPRLRVSSDSKLSVKKSKLKTFSERGSDQQQLV